MVQNWQKLDLTFNIEDYKNNYSHASVPIAFRVQENIYRIMFASRNIQNQSEPFFVDFDIDKFKFINAPVKINIPLGNPGTFDDSGIMPACLLQEDNKLTMYYIGWNLGVTVPFRNSVGVAISYDNGESFTKKYLGPVLDRTKNEPHFVASNCVLYEDGIYKTWYLNCLKWERINGKLHHYYHIKYATSIDGYNWKREGKVAIDFRYKNEYAISVPRVIKEEGKYKMWYSYRGGAISNQYRIGYAESDNGEDWVRKDELVDLNTTEKAWDSDMMCYPFIFNHKNYKYMLYNGNDYGKTGFGFAKLDR